MSKQTYFLVANYYMRPKHKRTQTQIKGWMDDKNNVSYDEQVTVTKRLKTNDYSSAKIILDLVNEKIIKNEWQPDANFDDLLRYFKENYPQYLNRSTQATNTNQPNETSKEYNFSTISSV